jgi:hypothetical protein
MRIRDTLVRRVEGSRRSAIVLGERIVKTGKPRRKKQLLAYLCTGRPGQREVVATDDSNLSVDFWHN